MRQTGCPVDLFLASSTYIDWHQPEIRAKARDLARGVTDEVAVARLCFEFVRDAIRHSWDFMQNPVTCRASDVLRYRTGYCYAKSHLLAALLRANGIPAGLCYQRLMISGDAPPYCLHGLNAVLLKQYGWYRIDARGNKAGVNAQFCPPLEKLAFPVISAGEADLPGIHSEPLEIVIKTLESQQTVQDVANNLPDIEVTRPSCAITQSTLIIKYQAEDSGTEHA